MSPLLAPKADIPSCTACPLSELKRTSLVDRTCLLLTQSGHRPDAAKAYRGGLVRLVAACGPPSPERSKHRNQHALSHSEQTASHAWVMLKDIVPFIFLVLGRQQGVLVMADENEVKQVQEPAQEQQQQQPTEQKPTEPPPPEQQVAETQAPEAAEAPSENPNP